MPLIDDYEGFQDALDYFYISESEDEYFSAQEHQPSDPNPYNTKKYKQRSRRKREKAITQIKLAEILSSEKNSFSAVDVLPRLPSYIPSFSERTVSAKNVETGTLPKQKRWQSATGLFDDYPKSKKDKKKSTQPNSPPKEKWVVDESEMTKINLTKDAYNKYKDFKTWVKVENKSPQHPDFPASFKIKHTEQCSKYKLYRIKLSRSYRASFLICGTTVFIQRAGPHE